MAHSTQHLAPQPQTVRLLLVEDDQNTAAFVHRGLSESGYSVDCASSGAGALKALQSSEYELVILDIMLPDTNGLLLCQQIRQQDPAIPILFLTALGTPENIAVGLDTGADDYLVKPFKFLELVARVRSLLRRTAPRRADTRQDDILVFDDIEMDDYRKTVVRAGQTLSLTSTEFKLLKYFLQRPGKMLSRAEILEAVWGGDY